MSKLHKNTLVAVGVLSLIGGLTLTGGCLVSGIATNSPISSHCFLIPYGAAILAIFGFLVLRDLD